MKICGEHYNRNDIEEKVEEYHNKGMDDEEVIKQIGEDMQYAEEFEHEFYGRKQKTLKPDKKE